MQDFFESIIQTVSEADVAEMLDEIIPEYVGDDWEEDFEDIFEAYWEQGRGEAEAQVVEEIVQRFMSKDSPMYQDVCYKVRAYFADILR